MKQMRLCDRVYHAIALGRVYDRMRGRVYDCVSDRVFGRVLLDVRDRMCRRVCDRAYASYARAEAL